MMLHACELQHFWLRILEVKKWKVLPTSVRLSARLMIRPAPSQLGRRASLLILIQRSRSKLVCNAGSLQCCF